MSIIFATSDHDSSAVTISLKMGRRDPQEPRSNLFHISRHDGIPALPYGVFEQQILWQRMKGTRIHIKSTTVVGVNRDGKAAMASDGQVTVGETIVKASARKVRRLYEGKVLAGFAGSVADALTLFEHFERKLEEYHGGLTRAAVEMAKEWRTDKVLRRLEALLLVADHANLLIISGAGEVIEPDDGVAAIGSGGPVALGAARALMRNTELPPSAIVREAIAIAGEVNIYTNTHITLEELS